MGWSWLIGGGFECYRSSAEAEAQLDTALQLGLLESTTPGEPMWIIRRDPPSIKVILDPLQLDAYQGFNDEFFLQRFAALVRTLSGWTYRAVTYEASYTSYGGVWCLTWRDNGEDFSELIVHVTLIGDDGSIDRSVYRSVALVNTKPVLTTLINDQRVTPATT